MKIDENYVLHSTLTNGTADLIISLMTYSETAVPIRIGSILLYFPDFSARLEAETIWCETSLWCDSMHGRNLVA